MKRLTALALALSLGAAAQAADLDGTRWKAGERKLLGGEDVLTFEGGRFSSAEWVPSGFNAGPYDARRDCNAVAWSALQQNAQGETLKWEGVRKGDRMEGSTRYFRADGETSAVDWEAELIR